MTYYIDLNHGQPDAAGTSPDCARLTYTDLSLVPGDTVLFKRGTFVRDILVRTPGAEGAPITYGAYGEGDNPVFCGSVDVSDPALWKEVRGNVWQYQGTLESEVCNFIYDNGRIGATLRWDEGQLSAQGDWYDTSMGSKEGSAGYKDEQKVFIWSNGNPGEVYAHIECAVWGNRWMSANRDWTVTEDLCFYGSGVHGFAGGADNVVVRRCAFCFIGGAVWNKHLKIRFGNAIEFWDHAENILIEDCYFNNIFDSCITHQGSAKCLPAKNLVMRNNLCINYGMGAYEGRDRMSIASAFNDNICLQAGGGFSAFGDTKPRNSEIFPQPMGHHVFMWRIPQPTEGGYLEFARNKFYGATGAAMFSYIAPEAEAQMDLHDNVYWTDNADLFQLMGGKYYRPNQFDDYLTEVGEKGAKWESAPDLTAEMNAWFQRTGVFCSNAWDFTDALPEPKYFVGSTDKDSLSYEPGEPMTFTLQLMEGKNPLACECFKYECWAEDGSHDKGLATTTDGSFTYTTSISTPGYVRLMVHVCDKDGKVLPGYDVFEGGACASFDKIVKLAEEPADYDAFWQNVIATELDPVAPLELERKEFHCGDPGDVVYDIKVACPGPKPVSGYLRLPRDGKDGTLPIIVSYMGYSVTTAPVPTKARAIQLYINPHGFENGLPPREYQALASQAPYASFGFHRDLNASPDTCYFKYMVLRVLQAIRYCKSMALWNGKDVTLCGGSMGAFQATHGAAFDKDVTALQINVPWMCDLRGIESGRIKGWRPEVDNGINYFDTVNAGARVTCPVKITAGLGDYVCPPSGVTSLYHAIQGEKSIVMLQNKTHPYTAPTYVTYTREEK